MSSLSDNRTFLLEQNALEAYPWSLWVIIDKMTGIKVQIVDSNSNNPKIQLMSARQTQAYLGITDTLPSYIATVIKEDETIDLVKSQYQFFISFDDGTTFTKCYAEVKESPQPDLYWDVVLTKVK